MSSWTDAHTSPSSANLTAPDSQGLTGAQTSAAPTTVPTRQTAPQRAAAAAQAVNSRLHLDDEKWLLAALAEVAAEEASHNPSFALRVRSRYEELHPAKKPRAPRTSSGVGSRRRSTPSSEPLVPIKQLPWRHIDVEQGLDPYFIIEYYGSHQLETALRRETVARLKEAISLVETRHPGAAPKGKLTKDAAISYILEYVLKA